MFHWVRVQNSWHLDLLPMVMLAVQTLASTPRSQEIFQSWACRGGQAVNLSSTETGQAMEVVRLWWDNIHWTFDTWSMVALAASRFLTPSRGYPEERFLVHDLSCQVAKGGWRWR